MQYVNVLATHGGKVGEELLFPRPLTRIFVHTKALKTPKCSLIFVLMSVVEAEEEHFFVMSTM